MSYKLKPINVKAKERVERKRRQENEHSGRIDII